MSFNTRIVIGSNWNDKVYSPEPLKTWINFERWVATQHSYDPSNPNAGWQKVPSARICKKRNRAAERRRARERFPTVQRDGGSSGSGSGGNVVPTGYLLPLGDE